MLVENLKFCPRPDLVTRDQSGREKTVVRLGVGVYGDLITGEVITNGDIPPYVLNGVARKLRAANQLLLPQKPDQLPVDTMQAANPLLEAVTSGIR